ncbi:peptidylprolyl isomerase [Nitriliruptoraceae bacterium ZYF776]|nr:peptidylprolyl isomerase [Profundirhabdus halotolerans]
MTEPPVEDVPEGPCPEPGDEVPTPTTVAYDEPPRTELEDGVTYTATIDTTCGVIEVELDAEGAPRTVENFVALAEDQYYNGVPFHRTIAGFMIQGGDPTGTGTGCVDSACETQLPGYTIDEETETPSSFEPYAGSELEAVRGATAPADAVVYPYGTVAMAKTDQPSSTGGQFFIVEEPLGAALPPEYSVLGHVTSGMEVVQDIAAGPVEGDRALRPVAIRAVTIERS